MNTKTTLYLAVVLVVLGASYYVLRSRPEPIDADTTPMRAVAASAATRDLLEDKLSNVVKVVCKHSDGREWVFEKDTETSEAGQDVWRMTSPMQMQCVRWEVDKFGNRLGNLQYELSYKPGEPGAVTAAQAGLQPPEATVTLTDADGRTATVEIGKPVSDRETYVRLAGSDEICVGKSDLRNLVKDRAVEYRDKQLWEFKPEDVTRVEIVDRSDADAPVSYAFSRDGARWMMASPVTARATSKVDDMLRAMSRLRAIEWHDDDPDKLVTYGLERASVSVRTTVEEEIPVEKEEEAEGEEGPEEPPETATETKVTVYELHLSDQSPIGEDTKTYMRVGDEHVVATVMKTTTDKFKPVMSEWREMRITPVNVNAATRIELTTPEGLATLVKKEGEWSFEPDGGRAEDSAVGDLLDAVGDLSAVVFIDEEPTDLASFGLDQPQAEIRLTIPGVEGVERITVGGYTDEKAKRLVYVRRNELASIAKVRTPDMVKLIEGPRVYRDRTVVEVLPSRFERIRLSTENRFLGGRNEVTLGRHDNTWSMAEPVVASVLEEQIDKLVEALGGLRAEQVVSEAGEPSAYGLHAPAVTVALTYKPPVEYRIEPPSEGEPDESGEEGDKTKPAEPVEVQPPPRTLELMVARHDGKYYAKRSDRGTVYEMGEDFFKQLVAEYRTDRVMDFEDDEVRRLSIRKGDQSHVFEKKEDDGWVYQAEPDLPLDSKKLDNLLLQVRDLRTKRYVRHAESDLSAYGLSTPSHEVMVTLDDGSSQVLSVSDKRGNDGTDKGHFAAVKGHSGVFLLTADSVQRFEVSLDDLEEVP